MDGENAREGARALDGGKEEGQEMLMMRRRIRGGGGMSMLERDETRKMMIKRGRNVEGEVRRNRVSWVPPQQDRKKVDESLCRDGF